MNTDVLLRATQIFQFLILEYGYSGPDIVEDRSVTVLRYKHTEVAIEVELDWQVRDVFLLIVLLKDDELPRGYYVDEHGNKCRIHISTLIGTPRRKTLPPLVRKDWQYHMLTALQEGAEMLRSLLPLDRDAIARSVN